MPGTNCKGLENHCRMEQPMSHGFTTSGGHFKGCSESKRMFVPSTEFYFDSSLSCENSPISGSRSVISETWIPFSAEPKVSIYYDRL